MRERGRERGRTEEEWGQTECDTHRKRKGKQIRVTDLLMSSESMAAV